MKIGDRNLLLVEKRGCNFFPNDSSVKGSDVGNYRVFIRFIAKDGTEVSGDVMRFRGSNILATQMSYYDDTANCLGFQWRSLRGSRPMDVNGDYTYPYTIAGILKYVNERSAEPYDGIKWVCSFRFEQEPGANFTPSSKIIEFAKREHLEYWQPPASCVRVKTYTGVWKYMMARVRKFHGNAGPFERVTIFLEEAI